MNERIEALKKLATKEVWGNNPHNGSPEFDGYELDADMFAELIVRECGVALSPMLRDMVSRGQAYDLIKQHFGVE